ncbi:cupin domain-containing protein [Nostoc sp.]|uniref:cupin domain-containing protein n=1 Tax=Nostoc sp. TaxID=1180 RepID=UPI002FFAACF4
MVSSQLQWQPQKVNENLSVRVAVLSTALTWYNTEFTGISFLCFESDNEIQDHPVTMLSRFDPGGFFELHGHPGGEEILVLQGNFADETGIYPPGTYMLNPEGFIHHPYSEEGCLTFVKLRQHGGKNRQRVQKNIYQLPWQSGIIPQIEVMPLYQEISFPEKVWIEHWQSSTALFNVVESEV